MSYTLAGGPYGKAEIRLLRVVRHGDRHEIRELTVTTALSGDFDAAYLHGDNSGVLPTDSQKNAVYALAAGAPPGEIEEFALRLAGHFAATAPGVRRARVQVDEHAWERIAVDGESHPHAFARAGDERRQAVAEVDAGEPRAAAGLTGLVVLKSAGSEFRGFARDRYTTLEEAGDRILATAVTARWGFATLDVDWGASFAGARRALLETFARRHSRSLQETLHAMGRAVLEARPEIAEIRLSLPNRHHFAVDLTAFDLEGAGDVFRIADRPYGVIAGAVRRDGAPDGLPLDW